MMKGLCRQIAMTGLSSSHCERCICLSHCDEKEMFITLRRQGSAHHTAMKGPSLSHCDQHIFSSHCKVHIYSSHCEVHICLSHLDVTMFGILQLRCMEMLSHSDIRKCVSHRKERKCTSHCDEKMMCNTL